MDEVKPVVVEGQMSLPQILYRQLLDVNRLASICFQDTSTSHQTNVRNYTTVIDSIEAGHSRHLDERYNRKLMAYRVLFSMRVLRFRYLHQDDAERSLFENQMALSFANKKLGILMEAFVLSGLLPDTSSKEVLEEEESEDTDINLP